MKDAPARSIETPTAVIARAIIPHDRRLAMTRYESFGREWKRVLTPEYVTLLGMLAATSSKIGREIYTLMKQEFGEVEEPFG